MPQFYTVPTAVGEAKIANAIALGGTINITQLAIGDGNGTLPTPDSDRTALVNEVRRGAINTSDVDPDNPNWIVVEQVLPPDVGGWTIREVGIYDEDDDLIAYGNYPETYKPVLSEGSGRTQTIRFVMQVSSTAAITLKVDPAVVLATRKYADDKTQQHAESRDHPAGTTTEQGMLQLATSQQAREGTRTDRAVHPGGLKAAIEQSSYQFAKHDPARTYETGETCRGSDGHFYEFYDRDQAGTVQGTDPTDPANRPHIWMRWDGVRPATVIEWRSENIPEGYVKIIGDDISRNDYRRIWDAWGTTYGSGDGVATFGTFDDRGELKRGWDDGRGVDAGRALAEHQKGTAVIMGDTSNTTPAVWSFHNNLDDAHQTMREALNGELSDIENASLNVTTINASVSGAVFPAASSMSVRPRNNAVIWLTKI